MSQWKWIVAVVVVIALLLPVIVSSQKGGDALKFANSPIHMAARDRGIEVIEEAIASGVNINAQDELGKTPLHYAAENGYLSAVRLMMANGADASILDGKGIVPLQYAQDNNHSGTAAALQQVASATPAAQERPKPAPPKPVAVAKVVRFADSPLHAAGKAGKMSGVDRALEGSAHIDDTDEFGKTALHYAAENGHVGTVQSLLAKGADASILDRQGLTAHQHAARNGHSQTAGALAAASASIGQTLNPALRYPDLASFERAIGQSGSLLKSDHVWLFAPKNLEEEAGIVHAYLVSAYDALYDIVGSHTEYIMVVYNFPQGHADAFGGTSNCTIWYDDTNLRLDQHEEWTQYGVPHVSGYIEEMAHNFAYTQFGWEMVGWSIGIKASLAVADNPIFMEQLRSTRWGQSETFERYIALGHTFPADIVPNQVDRIHAYLLWQCEDQYGPDFWRDFFREAGKERSRLSSGNRDERYRITVDCFDRLEGLNFKDILRANGISVTTDVKSMNPTKPGWNRKLE